MQSDTSQPPAARSPDRGIFISHGHADAELAESLARLLQHFLGLQPDQITCSSTPELGLRRGGDVGDEIRHRLERSGVFILLATANSASSQWVPLECGLASAAAERGTIKFFVAVPTPADRESVPAPYAQQVSVTLSQDRDTWQFLLQLRGELGAGAGDVPSFVESLLDLEQKCSAIEAARAAAAGLAREAEYRQKLVPRRSLEVGSLCRRADRGCGALVPAPTPPWAGPGLRGHPGREGERERGGTERPPDRLQPAARCLPPAVLVHRVHQGPCPRPQVRKRFRPGGRRRRDRQDAGSEVRPGRRLPDFGIGPQGRSWTTTASDDQSRGGELREGHRPILRPDCHHAYGR